MISARTQLPVPCPAAPHRLIRHRGFTLTELLVVIGIIVLLIGILLAALSKARDTALSTRTQTTMSGFSQAADTYQLEHGRFPGLVPDRVLLAIPEMTGTESAILALMGGARVLKPTDVGTAVEVDYDNYNGQEISVDVGAQEWKIKIDPNRIGEGPYVDGKTYSPYYTPKENELTSTLGLQANETGTAGAGQINGMPDNFRLPDLIDGWGQPIIFARRMRSIGPLVAQQTDNPQFLFDGSSNTLVGTSAYVQATDIGELRINQTTADGSERYSILNEGNANEKIATWEMLLGHPSLAGEARGAFALFSAGPDGIYFSRIDGPGSPSDPIDIIDFHSQNSSVVDEFDDIRVFGGN